VVVPSCSAPRPAPPRPHAAGADVSRLSVLPPPPAPLPSFPSMSATPSPTSASLSTVDTVLIIVAVLLGLFTCCVIAYIVKLFREPPATPLSHEVHGAGPPPNAMLRRRGGRSSSFSEYVRAPPRGRIDSNRIYHTYDGGVPAAQAQATGGRRHMVVELPPSFGRTSSSSRRSTMAGDGSPMLSRRSTIFDASGASSEGPSGTRTPEVGTPAGSRRNTRKLSRAADMPVLSSNHLARSSLRDTESESSPTASRGRRPSMLATSTSANSLSASKSDRRPSRAVAVEQESQHVRRSTLSSDGSSPSEPPSPDGVGGRRRPSSRRGNTSQAKGSQRSPLAAVAEANARASARAATHCPACQSLLTKGSKSCTCGHKVAA
jgi:hypothetical protein